MKKLFPLFLVAMFFCWSLAIADVAPTRSSADVSYMPDLTSSFLGIVETPDHSSTSEMTYLQFNDVPTYPNPTVEQCPTGSLFGQDPTPTTGGWTFANSEPDLGTSGDGYLVFENFSGVTDDICDIHFWGAQLSNVGGWHDCAENPVPFTITFYADNGGIPDTANPLCTYVETISGIPTGELYAGAFEAKRYEATLDPCCVITDGWVSIGGGGDPECWFMWLSSGETGQGLSYQKYEDGDSLTLSDYDLSLCLTPSGTQPDSGACCNDATGACIDNVLQANCPSPARWVANTLCVDLQPPCGTILGACCDDQGGCTQTTEQDCMGTIWLEGVACDPNPCPQAPPCTLSCPTNGIPEGEPDCFDGYVDNYNGGCNSSPPVFSSYTIGDTVCGKAGDYVTNDSLRRDTDWYEFVATTDNTLLYYGTAEFDLQLLIIESPTGNCSDYAIVASTTVPACSTGSIQASICPGRTYWLWAGEDDDDLVACGSDYQIWTELGAPPTGACCVGTDCVVTNTVCECDALGGNWYIGETCPGFQCPIVVDCEGAIWMNGNPTGGAIASQCEYDYAFAAGTADDFVLPGTDPVTLEYVVAWVWFWNSDPLATPADMDGVNVTIYAHDPGTSAPGGKPLDPPDSACSHVELVPNGIVYTTQLAQGSFGYLPDDTNVWRLMMPVSVTLDAGVTYWLEVEPILQPFATYGQVGSIPSDIQQGAGCMQIFELLGTNPWTTYDPISDVAFCLLGEGGGGECDYVTGDVNGSDSYNGLDVTYGVAYFKGGNDPICPFGSCPVPPCDNFFYCGDVNGSCSYNGLDITYGVAYFKGGDDPIPCPDCPPAP